MNALITGASGGIGYELALLLAKAGYHLILVARNLNKLEQVKTKIESEFGNRVLIIALDLTAENACNAVFDRVQKENLKVDLLVNNAGFGSHGRFNESSFQAEKKMIELNILALTQLTKLFLPGMISRKSGTILNVASTAAFLPGPLMSVYYATKAYVQSFSVALSVELKNSGIKVISLCPGPTETGFAEKAKLDNSRIFKSGMYRVMSAQAVAKDALSALNKKRSIVISGFMNKIMVFTLRFAPRWLPPRLVMWMNQRR